MKQKEKQIKADLVLAALLILGSLVLAAFSWWLPNTLQGPMTAKITGTITSIEKAYGSYCMAISLDNYTTQYTFLTETYEALEKKPAIGEAAEIKYDITSMHEVRRLEVRRSDGSKEVLYSNVNPMETVIWQRQAAAFAVYGIFAAVCVGGYLVKTRRQPRRA